MILAGNFRTQILVHHIWLRVVIAWFEVASSCKFDTTFGSVRAAFIRR